MHVLTAFSHTSSLRYGHQSLLNAFKEHYCIVPRLDIDEPKMGNFETYTAQALIAVHPLASEDIPASWLSFRVYIVHFFAHPIDDVHEVAGRLTPPATTI